MRRSSRDPEEIRIARNLRRRAAYAQQRGNSTESIPSNVTYVDIGYMNFKCSFCGALKFINEQTRDFCCSNGKVVLADYQKLPETIVELISESSFHKNVRAYNQAFAFTSMRVHLDNTYTSGIHNFLIQGQLYHEMGYLQRDETKFAQLYIVENDQPLKKRKEIFPDLNEVY